MTRSTIRLPKMDGYEPGAMVARIAIQPGSTALVMLTGFTRAENVHRADECGFDAHISKPLWIGQLTATMQRLLGGREHNGNG